MPSLRIVGAGRAGGALASALGGAGWDVVETLGRADDVTGAAEGVDVVVIATPDGSIAEVARLMRPDRTTVIAHMAGSFGLDVLAPHERRAALHPLVALPSAEVGARRLRDGAWFAVAGDPIARLMAEDLGGRWFEVRDADRPMYHAAAVIASNHLVALMGQVERVAGAAGVPFEAYIDLIVSTVDNVAELGPRAALTGPVVRGDSATIESHLAALDSLDPLEREAYEVMVRQARRLIGDERCD